MNTSETASSSDPEHPSFENLKYEIVDISDDILLENQRDSNVNFFNLKIQNVDLQYILLEEFQNFIESTSHDSFSILHLNIRRIKKNFDNFNLFFSILGFSFSVICFSETWLNEVNNSLYELPNYISKHQVRDDRKGGGVSICTHNSLSFKVLSNLCINSVDIEFLSIELSLDNKRSTLLMFCTDHLMVKLNRSKLFQSSFFLLSKMQIKTCILLVILTFIYLIMNEIKSA